MNTDIDLDDLESIADAIDDLADRINQTLMNYETEHKGDPWAMKLQEAKMHLSEAEDKVRFLL